MRRLLLASLLLIPAAAHADSFTISVSANGSTVSGVLNGTSQGNGSYLITSISGTTLATVLPVNSAPYGNDNLFFPTATRLFDANGLAFSGVFGSANLFSTLTGYAVQGLDEEGSSFRAPVAVSLVSSSTVTPEPSSILLSFTGLAAVAGFCMRKRFTGGASGAAA